MFLGLDFVLCGHACLADEEFSGLVHWLDPGQVSHDCVKFTRCRSRPTQDKIWMERRPRDENKRMWAKISVNKDGGE